MKNTGLKKTGNLVIYWLTQDLASTPEEIQILPSGWVVSQKGSFLVDEQAMADIFQAFSERVNDIVVDYEHQTLTGDEAPAAGWIKELINKGQDGLWAKIEWTPRAAEYIKNKEYRYFSPVILVRKSDGRAVYLHSGALTNDPAIDGMQPIINKFGVNDPEEDDSQMDLLKKLALKLSLKETATEEEVMQAVAKLQNPPQIVANKDVLSLLDLPETANLDETKGKIIALKNPSGYVKAEDFNALKQKLDLKERDDLVTQALKSGKVAPAQKEWAEQYALKDPAGFKAFLEKAPVVVPVDLKLDTGDGFTPPAVNDETQMSVNKQLGITDDEFKKIHSPKA